MLEMAVRDLEMKEFSRSPLVYEKPWRVDIDGRRHYTDGVVVVPSVTTVLGTVNEGKFDWWYE